MKTMEKTATVGTVNPRASKEATSLNREVRKELRTKLVNGALEYVIRTYFLKETVSLGYPFGSRKVWKYIPEDDEVINRSKVNEPILLANGEPFTNWNSHTDRYNNYYDNSFVGHLTYKEFVAEVKKDYHNAFMFTDFSALSDRAFDSLLDTVSK